MFDDMTDQDQPPQTLPGDFFDKPGAAGAAPPQTLPGDFFDKLDQQNKNQQQTTTKPPAPSAWWDPGREAHPWLTSPIDVAQGAASGAASTLYGLNQLVSKGAQYLPGSPQIPNVIPKEYTVPPPNLAGQIGHYGEQAAEFLLPAGKLGQAGKAIDEFTKVPYLVRLAGKAGIEAVPAYGITLAQTGGDTDAARNAAIMAAGVTTALPLIGAAFRYTTGASTGAGEYVVNRAMTNPTPELQAAMRGEITEAQVLANTREAVENVARKRSADYVARLAQIDPTLRVNVNPARQALNNIVKDFGIDRVLNPQTQQVELDFANSHLWSDPAAQQQVRTLWSKVMGPLSKDPRSVDSLKRGVDQMYREGGQSRAIVQRVKDTLRESLDKSVPGYQDMTREYAEASDFLDNLTELSTGNKNDGTAIRKLAGALKQNNNYRKDLLEALNAYTNKDLVGQVAGSRLSSYNPRGIVGAIAAGTGAGGAFLGPHGLFLSGASLLALFGMSPRIVGEAAVKAGVGSRLLKTGVESLPSAFHAPVAQPGAAPRSAVPQVNYPRSVFDQPVPQPYQPPGQQKSVFDNYAEGGRVHYDYGGDVEDGDQGDVDTDTGYTEDPVLREIIRHRMLAAQKVPTNKPIQLGAHPGQFYQQPFKINPEQSKQQMDVVGRYQDPTLYNNPNVPPPPPAPPRPQPPLEQRVQQPEFMGTNEDLLNRYMLNPMASGTGKLMQAGEAFSNPIGSQQEGLGVLHRGAAGAMEAATPLMLESGLASPAALLKTLTTLYGAGKAQEIVQDEMRRREFSPEATALGGDVAGLVGGAAIHGGLHGEPVPAGEVAPAWRSRYAGAPAEDATALTRAQLGIGEPAEADAARGRQIQNIWDPEAAQGRIDQFWKDQGTQLNAGLPVHVLADYSIVGARKIIDGAGRFVDWSRGMLDTYGPQVQPYLRQIWGEAQHIAGAVGWGEEGNQEMPLGNRLTVHAGPVPAEAPVIAQQSVLPKVQENLANLDLFHQRNPSMFASNETYIRGMNELFRPRNQRVPIPPDNLIAYSNNTPALGASIDEVSPQQRALAEEGLQAAGRVRQAYAANTMTPIHTGLYFGWGALSPRQSPYPQEAGFLHAVDSGLGNWIDMAARGQFNQSTLPAYLEWSGQVLKGTPGAQATSNLNSFGRQFLMNAGLPVENGLYRGMRTIDALHQIIGDQNLSSIEARRRYQQINNGLGIDNKVFSFILLVTGHPDTLVADRVRINDFWDAPKLEQQGLSYTTNEQGMMEPTRNLYDNGLNQAWNGITGLGMYEAAERALADRVRQEYANRGINDGTLGRWHWETWLAKSGQEVSHGSLGAIAKMGGQGLTPEQAVIGEGVRQGKYNDLSYGVRYERAPQGFQYNWEKSNGDIVSLTPEQHTQVLQGLREMRDKKKVSGYTENERIIPYGTRTSESTTAPWHELPGINRNALDRLLDRLSKVR